MRQVPLGRWGTRAAQAMLAATVLLVLGAPALAQNGPVDLRLTKTHEGNFTTGGVNQFAFVVSNEGTSSTTQPIVVNDELPAGLTFVSHSGAGGWSCTASGQSLTCSTTQPLGPNQGTTVLVAVQVGAPAGTVVNTATLSYPNDTNPGNNGATDSIVIVGPTATTAQMTPPPDTTAAQTTAPPTTAPPTTAPPTTAPATTAPRTTAPATTAAPATTSAPTTTSPQAMPVTGPEDILPLMILAVVLLSGGSGLVLGVNASSRAAARRSLRLSWARAFGMDDTDIPKA